MKKKANQMECLLQWLHLQNRYQNTELLVFQRQQQLMRLEFFYLFFLG